MFNKTFTKMALYASMFSVDFLKHDEYMTTKVQTTQEKRRRGAGTAFTKGKRHKSQKERSNRRKRL